MAGGIEQLLQLIGEQQVEIRMLREALSQYQQAEQARMNAVPPSTDPTPEPDVEAPVQISGLIGGITGGSNPIPEARN